MKMYIPVLLLLLLAACDLPASVESGGNSSRSPVEVLSVIDGDTISILYEGEETTVRYLLIDTPETNHPRHGEQPLGKRATAANKRLLESGEVTIEFDKGERFDDYDRLLAYLYVDGESVQEQLIREGYARVAYVFEPNTRYLDEFEKAELQAQDQRLGIWEFENYATERGFDSGSISDKGDATSPSADSCAIKGNINRKGDKIYHMPGSASYDQTNPEKWFCSEREARDDGFRNATP